MAKPKTKARQRPPRNYHKYHLVIRNKKGKQIVANFGLRKYTEGKTVGKSFYMQFNPDGLYYTPTFIQENVSNKWTPQDYLKDHEKKLKRSRHKGQGQMKVPRPRGNANNYCAVCRIKYSNDYFEHIGEKEHTEKRDNDKYQKMILRLQKFYLRKKQRRWQKLQEKKHKKTSSKEQKEPQKTGKSELINEEPK